MLLMSSGLSQQPEKITDPAKAYNMAAQAIAAQKWDEGMKAVGDIISTYGADGKKSFGPAFGHFYYLRGLLQIGKKQYSAAGESFRICYEDYQNPEMGQRANRDDRKEVKPNLFRNAALVQWGNIEMHQQRFAEAVKLYEKALEEGRDDPKVNRIYVTVNLGRCRVRSDDLKGGFDLISPALVNPAASEGLKQVIFMILAEDWTPNVKDMEQVQKFIEEYRTVVSLDLPEDRYERNPRFQSLAQKAFEEGDPIRALTWYSLMIDPIEMLPPVEAEIKALEEREVAEEMQAKKEEFLSNMREEKNRIIEESWQLLNGVGSVHFQMQNFGAAYAIFDRLSKLTPEKEENRPVYLHNAVASAARIGKWVEAYEGGSIFLDAYRDHELMPDVSRVLVEIVFLRGDYEDAYAISGDVRGDMKPGEEVRDIPDFVYGASAFHLNKLDEAESELSAYLSNYPEGQRSEPVEFYQGLTKIRLFKWEEAAALLNGFIERYPDSGMLPDALHQCALAEFMMDQFEPALAKVERVIGEFANHQIIAKTWNLRGDIFATEGRAFEDIVKSYSTGKQLAGRLSGEEETAAYSLWQLLIHTVDVKEWETCAAYITEFGESHAGSVYRLDFLAASLPALVELGQKDEALTRLREIIFEFGDQPESVELAQMFGSYLDFLKNNYSREEALAELEAQSEKAFEIPALKGWILVGLADIYSADEAFSEERNQVFYRLSSQFDPAANSNFVTVQLARWITEFRKAPDEARALYDFIIENRPGTANYNFALVDTAKLLADSDKPEDRKEALARFDRVLREVAEDELQELAVLGMARIHSKEKAFPEAQPLWERYLDNREWTVSRPEANYEYARCFDEQGKTSEALKIYVSVYANFPGHLDWSTRSYVRTAMILKEGGNDLKALLVLRDMLQRMGHHDHPVIDQAKKLFVKWRNDYQPEGRKGSAKGGKSA